MIRTAIRISPRDWQSLRPAKDQPPDIRYARIFQGMQFARGDIY
jgi:hypothetical protein